MAKRIWLSIIGLIAAGLVCTAITIFSWTIDETHFDRPDEGFDRLVTQIESLPGVSIDAQERWVEASTFADPSSRIELTVNEASLPGLLEASCTTEYPETVSWSLRTRTDGGNVVSVHGDSTPSEESAGSRCPDFGFDAVGLVGEVDSVARGLVLQATIWDDGRFALVAPEDDSGGIATLLPLVAHSDDLRDAAGIDSHLPVEINAATLGLIVESGEHDRYHAVLSDLTEEHGVTSYRADGGTWIDGVEKVQIVAPDREHTAIEDDIRGSGLHIADLPVRFIPLDP